MIVSGFIAAGGGSYFGTLFSITATMERPFRVR
jgi:hypothetical protein